MTHRPLSNCCKAPVEEIYVEHDIGGGIAGGHDEDRCTKCGKECDTTGEQGGEHPVLNGSLKDTTIVIKVVKDGETKEMEVTTVQALQMLQLLLGEKGESESRIKHLEEERDRYREALEFAKSDLELADKTVGKADLGSRAQTKACMKAAVHTMTEALSPSPSHA